MLYEHSIGDNIAKCPPHLSAWSSKDGKISRGDLTGLIGVGEVEQGSRWRRGLLVDGAVEVGLGVR